MLEQWYWLIVGLLPYRMRWEKQECFVLQALFWTVEIRLEEGLFCYWEVYCPAIERLRGTLQSLLTTLAAKQ